MHITNSISEYGLIAKLFHWTIALILILQIPLGFYLVNLDYGSQRISIENIHIVFGLTIFYLTIFRLLNNILNPVPQLRSNSFIGQKFIARLNHLLLYITLILVTVSGFLKKLFNGEQLVIFFKEIKLENNFKLADQFYDIHIYANYLLIVLISLHIFAVIVHKIFFNDNILKKML